MPAGQNKIKNPQPLSHMLTHHAKGLKPVAAALSLGYLNELQPRGWDIDQAGNPKTGGRNGTGFGAKSYFIEKGSKQYHFRPDGWDNAIRSYTEIVAKDSYRNGRVVARMKSDLDVMRFIRARVAES